MNEKYKKTFREELEELIPKWKEEFYQENKGLYDPLEYFRAERKYIRLKIQEYWMERFGKK